MRASEERWSAEVLTPAARKVAGAEGSICHARGNPRRFRVLPSVFRGRCRPDRISRAYPFTRGIHPTMYRGRLWSMRMFSGFGTPEDTNRRFRYLLQHGESGLSIAFDDPRSTASTLDDRESLGEVGKCGVNVSSLEDMGRLLNRIPLGQVTTSMTINGPAKRRWGMFILTAEGMKIPGAGRRHHPERHSEGIHCAEGASLSTPSRRFAS